MLGVPVSLAFVFFVFFMGRFSIDQITSLPPDGMKATFQPIDELVRSKAFVAKLPHQAKEI